ncbi:glycoside hydrolase family 37 protein [Penicillium manginii]|uniref:glycoside hydrolase family 37 protein n=1 Tax=Penicillium manginii TaxID=203109 RepID=UPI002548D462|nr:glycoside hydrolase family 37 protein [Penicillium manginii]KAJ5739518.1 glycoside hydrolase family 37 protein [Penicillium manginii]
MVELTALATITSDSSDFKRASDKSKGGEENLFLSLYSLTTDYNCGYSATEFLVPIQETLQRLLAQEDTDNDYKITVDDKGPKNLLLGSVGSDGFRRYEVRGTYPLSVLLQELSLLQSPSDLPAVLGPGQSQVSTVARLTDHALNENPVTRLSRLIRTSFWDNLTRRIDTSNVARVAKDPKDWTPDSRGRLYVPRGALMQYEYYKKFVDENPNALNLDVILLPENITPEYVRDLNDAPGILALEVDSYFDPIKQKEELRGVPFVVPGARFNELYGWDSYFIVLGLLRSDRLDLARGIIRNFCFCIEHYGKVFNANRTYYLGRSQPPFLTDMALSTFKRIKHEPGSLELLRLATWAAIKEYNTVWTASPRLDPLTGLSRYQATGVGVPPETEKSHFVHLLSPYAKKHNLSMDQFIRAYNHGEVSEPELDEYFLHDRSLRESGHDTSYRLEKVCANLVTVDLNSLLYKYETDIAFIIREYFDDALVVSSRFAQAEYIEQSALWDRRAQFRRTQMDAYLWNEEKGLYLDYNVKTQQQMPLEKPNRQWDYPFGWAPHQIIAWNGLLNYGYQQDAQRLAYKWLFMMTKTFVEFNGVVVEKYDVTRSTDSHKVNAEYGNQGADFRGVSREGFGWANSSYLCGLELMNTLMKRCLGVCAPFELVEEISKLNRSKNT